MNLKNAIKELAKKPLLLLPGIFIIVLGYLVSFFSKPVLQLNPSNQYIIILLAILTILLMSVCYTWLIRMCKQSKLSFSKSWLRNFFSILVLILAYNLVNWISFFLAYTVGKGFNLTADYAKIIFFVLYIIGILTIMMSVSMMPFILTISQIKLFSSFSISFKKAKENYLYIGSILVIWFAIQSLADSINPYLSTISAVIIIPIVTIMFTDIL